MSRIRRAYEIQFRELLRQVQARKLDQGVQWLLAKADRMSASKQIAPATALTCVYEQLAGRLPFNDVPDTPSLFLCDAGLGGLARWLRATGQDARWVADISDDALLRAARGLSATILTTDR